MRKGILLLIALATSSLMQAQGGVFKLGVIAGITTHDSDVTDFWGAMLGADAYYMFENEDAIINFGPTVGLRNYFGKEVSSGISVDDATFIPLGAAARLTLFGILTGGADAGYAIGLTDGLDGGFYFRPIVGIDILDILELNASYETIFGVGNGDGVVDGVSFGNLNIGLLLAL